MQQQQSSNTERFNGAKDVLRTAVKGGTDAWDRFDKRFDVSNIAKNGKEQAKNHPVMAFFLGFTIFVCSIPIFGFVIFAVISLVISIVGFVFVEGTLLTLGLCILSGVLLVVGFFAITFGGFIALSWVLASSAYSVAHNVVNKQSLRAPLYSRGFLTPSNGNNGFEAE